MCTVNLAVEGIVDRAVAERLILHVGAQVGNAYGLSGKSRLRSKVKAYCQAAHLSPWLILVDLNSDAECAPALIKAWSIQSTPCLCFRVAVRAVEAWLLAHADAVAAFLGVQTRLVPPDPESLADPKQTLVDLARQSPHKDIRQDMVPAPRAGRREGPAYAARLIDFVEHHWDLVVAAKRADSLRRAMECLEQLCRNCA